MFLHVMIELQEEPGLYEAIVNILPNAKAEMLGWTSGRLNVNPWLSVLGLTVPSLDVFSDGAIELLATIEQKVKNGEVHHG